MSYILGIDPGIEGAWGVVDQFGRLVSCGDLPTVGDGTKRMVSAPLIASIVKHWPLSTAVVEKVGAMPGQGVSSMFRFGRACGVIEGAIAVCGIPIHYVTPQVWKRHFGLPSDKEPSRQRAIELWPELSSLHFGRKKDHGRAEASLIALWGAKAEIAGKPIDTLHPLHPLAHTPGCGFRVNQILEECDCGAAAKVAA